MASRDERLEPSLKRIFGFSADIRARPLRELRLDEARRQSGPHPPGRDCRPAELAIASSAWRGGGGVGGAAVKFAKTPPHHGFPPHNASPAPALLPKQSGPPLHPPPPLRPRPKPHRP